MVHGRLLVVLSIVLLNVIIAGCGGPTSQSSAVLADPAAASSSGSELSGTWRGYFINPGSDSSTSPGNTDLTLQIRDDSTYTLKFGSRPERKGTVVAKGNRVYLDDPSGSQMALVYSGGTLHGGMKDTAPPGRTVMMSLTKDQTTADRAAAANRTTVRSRLCETAGGTYSDGFCEPNANPDWKAYCEARGGTYFAGGSYCEVPGGGLRPL
jgi:hypothetical protein